MSTRKHVFLSYSRSDLASVQRLYGDLRRRGIDVWFDIEELTKGPWLQQIQRAIYRSHTVIFCMSNSALAKLDNNEGFQEHELAIAQDIVRNAPPTDFTVIPVRLEECGRGDHRLSTLQQFDLFDDWNTTVERLARALGGVSQRDSWLMRAQSQMLQGDYIVAYEFLITGETTSESDQDILYLKAVCLFNLRRYSEALDAFNVTVNRYGPTVATSFGKALALDKLDRIDDARRELHRAMAEHPDSVELAALNISVARRSRPSIGVQQLTRYSLNWSPCNSTAITEEIAFAYQEEGRNESAPAVGTWVEP